MNPPAHYLKKELDSLLMQDTSIFHFLLSGSLDGVGYWDLEAPEHEWMSERFWTLLGYDPSEKNHLAAEWPDLIDPEDLTTTLDNFKRHCENPEQPFDQVVRYKHKNGSTVWARCRGIAIRDDKGKPIRMLGAHTELTREKLAEKQLEKHRDHLEELIFERTEKLHRLAGKVLFAQEEERSRLARELHDDLTQRLVGGVHSSRKSRKRATAIPGSDSGTAQRDQKPSHQTLDRSPWTRPPTPSRYLG